MALTKTARACLVTGVFTAGVVVAAGPTLATAAVDAYKDVVVRNGEDNPVPTKATGTTKVDATGQTLTINGVVDANGSKVDATGSKVDASGSSVTIQGDPSADPVPVTVTNEPASGAAAEPLSKMVHLWTDQTAGAKHTFGEVAVPADENWRIDHVAVNQADYRNGGAAPVHEIVVDSLFSTPRGFTGIAGSDHALFSQDVMMYASAGRTVLVQAGWRNASDDKGLVVVTLTGEKTKVAPSTTTSTTGTSASSDAAMLKQLSSQKK